VELLCSLTTELNSLEYQKSLVLEQYREITKSINVIEKESYNLHWLAVGTLVVIGFSVTLLFYFPPTLDLDSNSIIRIMKIHNKATFDSLDIVRNSLDNINSDITAMNSIGVNQVLTSLASLNSKTLILELQIEALSFEIAQQSLLNTALPTEAIVSVLNL